MGRHNGEAGESPALSRNCKLYYAASQDDPSDRVPNQPRDKEIGTLHVNQSPVSMTGLFM
jgi:hypothetical protein